MFCFCVCWFCVLVVFVVCLLFFVCLLALVCILLLCLLVSGCCWFFVGLCICWFFVGSLFFVSCVFVVFVGLRVCWLWFGVLLLCTERSLGAFGFWAQHTSSSRLCPHSAVGAWPAAPSVFSCFHLFSSFPFCAVHFMLSVPFCSCFLPSSLIPSIPT